VSVTASESDRVRRTRPADVPGRQRTTSDLWSNQLKRLIQGGFKLQDLLG
jgi:hypothetical protein